MQKHFAALLLLSALGACSSGNSSSGSDAGAADSDAPSVAKCADGHGGCDANATCVDSASGPSCMCKAGFSGDGKICTDIDECATNQGGCDANATCTNSVGSFSCACGPGFDSDGHSCVPKFSSLSGEPGHACVLHSDHSIWCWGGGTGDAAAPHDAPAQIGQDKDWKSVSARGDGFSCALKTNGTLWCWGGNRDGQLGLGNTVSVQVPTQVGTDADWTHVETGFWDRETCALKQNGTLWCWGQNWSGLSGDGTSDVPHHSPAQVGSDTTWASFTVGDGWACGVKQNGTLWCWGFNEDGELGLGNRDEVLVPTQVGTDTDWSSVSGGDLHTCTLKQNGTLWCWGDNGHGELGDSTTDARTSPTQVGKDSDWAGVTAGRDQTCGFKRDGTGTCWGSNETHALGNVHASDAQTTPLEIEGGHHWLELATGGVATCGVAEDGLFCWGSSADDDGPGGLLGDGAQIPSFVAVKVNGEGWASGSSGGYVGCGLTSGGKLSCWGANNQGQLGDGTGLDSAVPVAVAPEATYREVSAATLHVCGIRSDDSLWCSGHGESGDLGDGQNMSSLTPVQVPSDSGWKHVSVAFGSACAVRGDSTVWCWGMEQGNAVSPVQIGADSDWATVSTKWFHACGLKTNGSLWCWGHGRYGALGQNDADDSATPRQVGSDTDWASVTAADWASCALKKSGALYCWGDNSKGQLGVGDTAGHSGPQAVTMGNSAWKAFDVGALVACGIASDATLWCWGSNADGMALLGDKVGSASVQTKVSTDTDWVGVSITNGMGMAWKADGSLWSSTLR